MARLSLKIRDPKARADVEDNFRKTVGQVLGGAAVLIGAGAAYWQFTQQQQTAYQQILTQQQAAEKAQQAAHDLLISNQVSKGFEQLAGTETAMRLGGIYALEGVMNAPSSQYRVPVLEALCAFVRGGGSVRGRRPGCSFRVLPATLPLPYVIITTGDDHGDTAFSVTTSVGSDDLC